MSFLDASWGKKEGGCEPADGPDHALGEGLVRLNSFLCGLAISYTLKAQGTKLSLLCSILSKICYLRKTRPALKIEVFKNQHF